MQQLVTKAIANLIALIKVRISEHQKTEEQKAKAQSEQIRQQELKRIIDEAKAKAPVEPVPVATPAPAKVSALIQPAAKPEATTSAPVNMQAEVFDLESLIYAVAGGHAPI